MKDMNQKTVLNLLRVHKVLSKTELSERTSLSLNAIGMITSSLMNEDYIYVTGVGESSGGRKPELLSLKPSVHYAAGVDIDVDRVRIITVDIAGNVISRKRIPMNCVNHPDETLCVIEQELSHLKSPHFLGAGFAVAGQVDTSRNIILSAPNLKWKNIELEQHMSKDMPIWIENEAAASAIYEYWNGSGMGCENFICINSKSGIGAGIYINGRIYKGISGSAGEVGHMTIEIGGRECKCGSRGCLEAYASSNVLSRKLNVSAIEDTATLARTGNQEAMQAFLQVSSYLGATISNLVNLFNPEKIILGKEFVKYGDIILKDIRNVVQKNALAIPASRAEISLSAEGELSSVLGAAMLPMYQLFGLEL